VKKIAIYGAGGFGKEAKFLIESINQGTPQFAFKGFLDDNPAIRGNMAANGSYDHLAIAIAQPQSRTEVYRKTGERFSYPNLIHPDVFIHPSVKLGKGIIVCGGARLTVDISIGDFVIINLNATIGHDVVIGSFSALMPSVNISGNVKLGERVFVGTAATILQGISVDDDAVIGAGALVTKDVPPGMVARGVPARFYQKK
jgi:sugar O-acyltransferase (sialic acid O-acetyltransferase NeuD family)